jgi:hypothetical protein
MAFIKVGSLWISDKPTKDGKKFLSGKIKMDDKEVSIWVFRNDKGDNPKRPDYVIQMKVEDEPTPPAPEPDDAEDNDDLPF